MNLNNVLMLSTGTNFRAWRNSGERYMMMHENIDLVFHEDEPEALTDESSAEEVKAFKAWHMSNRMGKNSIRNTMSDTVRGSVEELDLATDYMEAIERKFKESEKVEAARLSKAFYDLKYDGSGGVREHIMKLININASLRELLTGVNDRQVVHVVLHSLPFPSVDLELATMH
ncbi:uncharacterized protein LOC112184355 [Rosa chinensis]|uniref:uncharacterized protein LOC112184355 n=1 Tax=Rosa chinensis TaxID=74649 RepID=UPI000D093DD3|nr:uncharacterized protein LOC112184355 [Rosa chinensis]